MFVLGLTGGSGAGKGYVSALFDEYGISSLDTDTVSREVTVRGSECLLELCSFFGEKILNEDGTLDRAALAKIAFSDSEKLAKLNEITHKYILASVRRWLAEREKAGAFAAIVDAPQLFESGFDRCCDYIIAVTAPRKKRLERIIKRDGITEEAALRRMANQHDDLFFRAHSDFVIINDDVSNLKAQIDLIVQQIKIN